MRTLLRPDDVTVKLNDKREFSAKISSDIRIDVAIIKIETNNLPAVAIRPSKLDVGEWL